MRAPLFSLAMSFFVAPAAAIAEPTIPQLLAGAVEIPLQSVVNKIADFAGDGREALVISSWRENGNAHSYNLYLVLIDGNVVGVDHEDRFADFITDNPHTGEDIVTAVRFLRVLLNGHRQTVLVEATRHWSETISAPAPTSIELFALKKSDGDIGETTDYFARIAVLQTRVQYCNADMALKQEAGLPLPSDYPGPGTPTGCPS